MSLTFARFTAEPRCPLVLIAEAGAIREIRFGTAAPANVPEQSENGGVLHEAAEQLRAYFSGELRAFALPLAPIGTPFQQRVWKELLTVPYGETRSYSEIAREVGAPAAVRAVGSANGRNPIPIVIPCHRIIGANGKLTGFGGGLPLKKFLLELERSPTGSEFLPLGMNGLDA